MTNTEELREHIVSSGVSITFLAEKLGITRECFYKKLNNATEFKASEIMKCSQLLHLSNDERDRIFLQDKVN